MKFNIKNDAQALKHLIEKTKDIKEIIEEWPQFSGFVDKIPYLVTKNRIQIIDGVEFLTPLSHD